MEILEDDLGPSLAVELLLLAYSTCAAEAVWLKLPNPGPL